MKFKCQPKFEESEDKFWMIVCRRITFLQEKGTLIDEGKVLVSGCVGGGLVRWNDNVRDLTDMRGTISMNLDSYSFIHPAKHLGLLNGVLAS